MKDKIVHKRQATHKKDKERFHDLQEQQAQATCSQHRDGASKLIMEAVTHCSGYLLAPCGFSEWTTGPEFVFESN